MSAVDWRRHCWTIQLATIEAKKRGVVERAGRESIRVERRATDAGSPQLGYAQDDLARQTLLSQRAGPHARVLGGRADRRPGRGHSGYSVPRGDPLRSLGLAPIEAHMPIHRGAALQARSCACLDYATNELGTCKHIERVRRYLGMVDVEEVEEVKEARPHRMRRLESRGLLGHLARLRNEGADRRRQRDQRAEENIEAAERNIRVMVGAPLLIEEANRSLRSSAIAWYSAFSPSTRPQPDQANLRWAFWLRGLAGAQTAWSADFLDGAPASRGRVALPRR